MKFASRAALPLLTTGRRSAPPGLPPRRRPLVGARSLAVAASMVPAFAAPGAGKSFARKRIEHAVEVAGACIMLAVFLMLALLA
ncbi:MAG: hypothetical protein JNL08_17250 [Planctomycetes bacterium]|nr:hypothetical protein [Planctomycetota bacterium]